jgi:hypothetical protein
MLDKRTAVKTRQKYSEILNEKIKQHKNLLIGRCVLTIFGISRLIISLTLGYMKSASGSWLFHIINSNYTYFYFIFFTINSKLEYVAKLLVNIEI